MPAIALQVYEAAGSVDAALVWNEAAMLRSCTHPRILPLYGISVEVRTHPQWPPLDAGLAGQAASHADVRLLRQARRPACCTHAPAPVLQPSLGVALRLLTPTSLPAHRLAQNDIIMLAMKHMEGGCLRDVLRQPNAADKLGWHSW